MASIHKRCLPVSPRWNELRHIEVFTRLVRATGVGARSGLVQARGHPAVGQAHVAEDALGIVAQRDRKLTQVAGELAPLAQYLARHDMRLADDLAGIAARPRADLLGLLLGLGAQPLEVRAAGGDQALGLLLAVGEQPA